MKEFINNFRDELIDMGTSAEQDNDLEFAELGEHYLQLRESDHTLILEPVIVIETNSSKFKVESKPYDGKANTTTYRYPSFRKFGQANDSPPTLFKYDTALLEYYNRTIKLLVASSKIYDAVNFDLLHIMRGDKETIAQVLTNSLKEIDNIVEMNRSEIYQDVEKKFCEKFDQMISQSARTSDTKDKDFFTRLGEATVNGFKRIFLK